MSKKLDLVVPAAKERRPSAEPELAPATPRALVVLPDRRESDGLADALAAASWDVELAESAQEARARLGEHWDAVVADPELDGLALVDAAASLEDGPAVLLIAGFGTVGDAVEAMRRGAFDYLSRPISREHVLLSLSKALERRSLRCENRRLRESLGERFALGWMHSADPRMRRVAEVVDAIADTRANVLITGESGTGKTLLARTIHLRSSRAARPFVVLNCGALPAGLLESELFGHARGAFTGAVRDKPGLFEAAELGTLFLDEIATAPPELQVKLLRVVQDRVFERVGETLTRTVDVRLIAATNQDLAREVAAGRFREDLFWRLHVVALELPPLRERPGDIPLLAERFLERYRTEHRRPAKGFEPDALALLCACPWPGNVRQLENAIERAVLLSRGATISPQDFGPELQPAPALGGVTGSERATPGSLRRALEEPEKRIIQQALEWAGGRRQEAAAILGVNRTTLFNKMRKYGLLDTPSARTAPSSSREGWSAGAPGRRAPGQPGRDRAPY